MKKNEGAQAVKIVTVCAWCPDAQERTEAARAHGFDVSHDICPACVKKFDEQAGARFNNVAGERS